jgi:hypothetical protein
MILVCAECGNPDWLCCKPGSEAENPVTDAGVHVLRPAAEVPPIALCQKCWILLNKDKKPTP